MMLMPLEIGNKYSLRAVIAAAGIVLSIVSGVPAQADDSFNDRYIQGSFTAPQYFRKCSELKDLSLAECEAKRYFVRYSFHRLVTIVHASEGTPNERLNYPKLPEELSNIKVDNRHLMSDADYFYTYDAPIFYECLKNECGKLFEKPPIGATYPDYWVADPAAYWNDLIELYSCLNKHEKNKSTEAVYKEREVAFRNAHYESIYGTCFSDKTPKRISKYSLIRYIKFKSYNRF